MRNNRLNAILKMVPSPSLISVSAVEVALLNLASESGSSDASARAKQRANQINQALRSMYDLKLGQRQHAAFKNLRERLGGGVSSSLAQQALDTSYNAAKEYYESAIQIAEDSPCGYFNLGLLLYARGDLDQSKKHLEKAAKLYLASVSQGVLAAEYKPCLAMTHYTLALICSSQNKEDYFYTALHCNKAQMYGVEFFDFLYCWQAYLNIKLHRIRTAKELLTEFFEQEDAPISKEFGDYAVELIHEINAYDEYSIAHKRRKFFQPVPEPELSPIDEFIDEFNEADLAGFINEFSNNKYLCYLALLLISSCMIGLSLRISLV